MKSDRIYSLFIFLSHICFFSFSASHESNETTLFDDFDSTFINSSRWHIATWSEHGGQTGKERCYTKDGFLHMVFINSSEHGYLSAAIQTRKEFLYGKWEARLKPSSVKGVLNSMYTIDWNNTADSSSNSNGSKQEIDIEFLTFAFSGDTGSVHFAVHEEDKESFQTNPDVPLQLNPSDAFHIWGFEITPEKIEWFVDSTILMSYTYAQNDIAITSPYQLKFNVWSAQKWINGPPEPDVESTYLIDWIRFTPYTLKTISGNNLPSAHNPVKIISGSGSVQLVYEYESATPFSLCRLFSLNGGLVGIRKRMHVSEKSVFTFSTKSFSPGCYSYQLLSGDHRHNGLLYLNR